MLPAAMRELESAPSLLASRVAASTFSAPIPTTQASLKGQAVQKVMLLHAGMPLNGKPCFVFLLVSLLFQKSTHLSVEWQSRAAEPF